MSIQKYQFGQVRYSHSCSPEFEAEGHSLMAKKCQTCTAWLDEAEKFYAGLNKNSILPLYRDAEGIIQRMVDKSGFEKLQTIDCVNTHNPLCITHTVGYKFLLLVEE